MVVVFAVVVSGALAFAGVAFGPTALAGVVGAKSVAASGPARKAGVASSRYLSSDPRKLSSLGAAWAYTWTADTPPSDPKLDWVPLVWGSGSVTPSVIEELKRDARSGRAHYLLGFNEPDSGSQANMSPAQAAALWPSLERTGLKLGSPAPAVPTDGWLSRFMSLARRRHLRVDYIALHYYQDFTNPNAVSDLRAQLIQIHNTYRKPLWITEIGAIDVRSWGEPMMRTPTDALADGYMRKLFAMLDALPFVQRYAWFTDDCWNHRDCRYGSLFTGAGKLSPAGRTYTSIAKRA